MKTIKPTKVSGIGTMKFLERTRKFLYLFKIKSWKIISRKEMGNKIVIETEKDITSVYVNGKEYRNITN